MNPLHFLGIIWPSSVRLRFYFIVWYMVDEHIYENV